MKTVPQKKNTERLFCCFSLAMRTSCTTILYVLQVLMDLTWTRVSGMRRQRA